MQKKRGGTGGAEGRERVGGRWKKQRDGTVGMSHGLMRARTWNKS